ncbi:MAG: sigma factor-like helix-turn-helix DNA-binding protein [Streptosporangiaceae bacterium]
MTRRTPEQAERLRQIVQMRRAHFGQDQIAAKLGISQQRVSQLYKQALTEVPAQDIEEHRAEELILIDDAIRNLLRIAMDLSTSPRTRVEAWNAIRGWSDRKARLLGLDAPARSRVEVITEDVIDAEIRRLETEIAAHGHAGGAAPAT